ncbi:hypothetical protein E0H68_33155 [Rhizobium leguminosarum bv. viciae]|nr:hypothetical protein E0H44_29745 [Rhizobium leguminosarum bv. viciae]TCA04886.1 hypothetical protein E0H68_33155 [Rhizobium leguminosarum bv. viciae]TCA16656.1 hypothetical protein E0H67_32490 [Rhizobium leguminosarum bv. viciae]
MPPAPASPREAEQVPLPAGFPHARSQIPAVAGSAIPCDDRHAAYRAGATANVFFNQTKKERRTFL